MNAKVADSCAWKKILGIRDSLIKATGSRDNARTTLLNWVSADNFMVCKAYSFLRGSAHRFSWHSILWDASVIPKHAIISFLAIHNALLTFDNILHRGFIGQNCCFLCLKGSEYVHHLFFSCTYSWQVLSSIKNWINLNDVSCNFKHILWVLKHMYRKDKWHSKFARVAIFATIYLLWMERNSRIFEGNFSTPEAIVRRVKFLTSARMLAIPYHLGEDIHMQILLG